MQNRSLMTRTLSSRRHAILVARIIEARKAAGLTQRELAAKLHVPQSAIAAIETGQRRIDVVEFVDIAKAVGVDPHELFNRAVGK